MKSYKIELRCPPGKVTDLYKTIEPIIEYWRTLKYS